MTAMETPNMPGENVSDVTNETLNITTYDYEYGEWDSFDGYWEFDVAIFINKYYLFVICGIGVPGNLACILTLAFTRPLVSSAVYMMTLAFADATCLVLKLTYMQLTTLDVRLGDGGCQLFFMLGTASQMFANWILVALTVERFVAVWFPFKVKGVCTVRNSVLTLIGMFVFFVLANVQFGYTLREVSDPFLAYDCRARKEYSDFIEYVWYWIDGALYAMVPIIVLLVLNTLILVAVKRSMSRQRRLFVQFRIAPDKLGQYSQQRQITGMLLVASIMFIVLILPNCVFFLVKDRWNWQETPHRTAQYYLVYQCVFVLSDASHALNFYIYCLSGRKFRQHFAHLVCAFRCYVKSKKRSNRTSERQNSENIFSGTLNVSTISQSPVHLTAVRLSPCKT